MTDPVYVVAEMGQTCKGDIDEAHRQVDAAKAAGASAFKTQLLTPDTIARRDARPYWHGSKVDTQRQSFAASGVIDYGSWAEVADHCWEVNLDFVATPFDLEAVNVLARFPAPVFKIASGDLTNVPLLRAVADATSRPIIVSTGAATESEILRAALELGDTKVHWLACTLQYPTPPHNAELARIRSLAHLVGQSQWSHHAAGYGYSDHVGAPESAAGAVFMGATVLEVHTTLTPGDTACPDDAMALDPERLAAYVAAANLAASMCGEGRLAPLAEELAARDGARRSICFARGLRAGHVLTADDLICLRPAGGVSPLAWDDVIGATLNRDVCGEDPLELRMLT